MHIRPTFRDKTSVLLVIESSSNHIFLMYFVSPGVLCRLVLCSNFFAQQFQQFSGLPLIHSCGLLSPETAGTGLIGSWINNVFALNIFVVFHFRFMSAMSCFHSHPCGHAANSVPVGAGVTGKFRGRCHRGPESACSAGHEQVTCGINMNTDTY